MQGKRYRLFLRYEGLYRFALDNTITRIPQAIIGTLKFAGRSDVPLDSSLPVQATAAIIVRPVGL